MTKQLLHHYLCLLARDCDILSRDTRHRSLIMFTCLRRRHHRVLDRSANLVVLGPNAEEEKLIFCCCICVKRGRRRKRGWRPGPT